MTYSINLPPDDDWFFLSDNIGLAVIPQATAERMVRIYNDMRRADLAQIPEPFTCSLLATLNIAKTYIEAYKFEINNKYNALIDDVMRRVEDNQ